MVQSEKFVGKELFVEYYVASENQTGGEVIKPKTFRVFLHNFICQVISRGDIDHVKLTRHQSVHVFQIRSVRWHSMIEPHWRRTVITIKLRLIIEFWQDPFNTTE